jgi:TRAP-type mannitol/chloroaromatic compound transport system permease small subunit
LAQASWAQFVSASRSSGGIVWWIAKAPTWIGLALLAIGCVRAVVKEDLVAPVTVEHAPVVS